MYINRNFRIDNGREFVDQILAGYNRLIDEASYWRSAYADLKKENISCYAPRI